MSRWHFGGFERPDPTWGADAFCPACNLGHEENCVRGDCAAPHIHAFTDTELRARDERIIRATRNHQDAHDPYGGSLRDGHAGTCTDYIIAAAEADQ